MPSAEAGEHFVTVFDRNFLPHGLCLYRSLERHGKPFTLWVVCMDALVEARLRELALPGIRLLPLAEVETPALRSVRPSRSAGEYCWTITPFAPQFVMDREPSVDRVTYLDADLFFFSDPRWLLADLDASGMHVLITPHAYSPEYDISAASGIYCVQFVTFRNSAEARSVLAWWQARCIEWCYARHEDGKFGDQKYLDDWPTRFRGIVHVLRVPQLALGPWNADRFLLDADLRPAFFHFHGFRVVPGRRLLLYSRYRLGPATQRLYEQYVAEFRAALSECGKRWGEVPGASLPVPPRERLRRALLRLKGAIAYARY